MTAPLATRCECDQFKQLWHSRIINKDNDHNVTYSLFKLSHGKEMYTEILPEHLKKALFQFRIGTYRIDLLIPVNNRKQLDVSRSERDAAFAMKV